LAEDQEKALDHWRTCFEFDDHLPEQLFRGHGDLAEAGAGTLHHPDGAL